MPAAEPAPVALIESRIYLIRGLKVLLDADLAALYQVETKVFNQAVRRNQERFPDDFMFQLTPKEDEALRSQIVTSNQPTGRGGRRYRPYAFTEQGVAMLSSVLTSKRAIEVNIAIMRTFVRLRQLLATNEELAHRLDELEWRQNEQGQQIQTVFEVIQHLIEAPAAEGPRRRIGFPTSADRRKLDVSDPENDGE
jgi:ORF6N domain-containing protein